LAKLAAAPPSPTSPTLPIIQHLFPSHGDVSSGKSITKTTFIANFANKIDISAWLHRRHRRRLFSAAAAATDDISDKCTCESKSGKLSPTAS
jgi:hypothetical protein